MELPSSTAGAVDAATAGQGPGIAALSVAARPLPSRPPQRGLGPLTGAGRTAAATDVDAGAAPLPGTTASSTGAGPGPLTGAGHTAAAGSLPASLPPLAVGLPRRGLHRRGLGPPHRRRAHYHRRRRLRHKRNSPALRGRGPCRRVLHRRGPDPPRRRRPHSRHWPSAQSAGRRHRHPGRRLPARPPSNGISLKHLWVSCGGLQFLLQLLFYYEDSVHLRDSSNISFSI
jgi:hypothetical protein